MAQDYEADVAGNYENDIKYFADMFKLNLLKYYFALPCVVVAVNTSAQTVDIRPTLKAFSLAEETSVSRALIKGVPFQVFRAGDTYISLPIKAGDTGLAVFCQRDISNWKQSGGEVALQTLRVLDYNDAIFFPYITPAENAISDYNADYIEIVKNGKKITVKDGVLEAPEYDIKCKTVYASGTITAEGTITSAVDCISGTISGLSHIHGGVATGTGTTGTPQ